MKSTIKYTISKQFVFVMSKNCFSLRWRNCSDPFNILPNKQRTKYFQALYSYEKLKNLPPNVIPSEKHCSTESNAGVLKHEKEELMDISSAQQDMNDVDSVTVGS